MYCTYKLIKLKLIFFQISYQLDSVIEAYRHYTLTFDNSISCSIFRLPSIIFQRNSFPKTSHCIKMTVF